MSKYIKHANLTEMRAIGAGAQPQEVYEATSAIYDELATHVYELMNKMITQIDVDVSKLRSRIDIDKI